MGRLSEDVRATIRFFAFFLGNGTLAMHLLDGIDYRAQLMTFGSDLEMVFTIVTNVLDVDEDGQVTNAGDAEYRAAQWIRRYCDPNYVIEPPLQPWETELAGP